MQSLGGPRGGLRLPRPREVGALKGCVTGGAHRRPLVGHPKCAGDAGDVQGSNSKPLKFCPGPVAATHALCDTGQCLALSGPREREIFVQDLTISERHPSKQGHS